jgi:hypothetical protein
MFIKHRKNWIKCLAVAVVYVCGLMLTGCGDISTRKSAIYSNTDVNTIVHTINDMPEWGWNITEADKSRLLEYYREMCDVDPVVLRKAVELYCKSECGKQLDDTAQLKNKWKVFLLIRVLFDVTAVTKPNTVDYYAWAFCVPKDKDGNVNLLWPLYKDSNGALGFVSSERLAGGAYFGEPYDPLREFESISRVFQRRECPILVRTNP